VPSVVLRDARSGKVLLALGVLLALALAFCSQAGAFIYWSQGFALGRANLDGTASLLEWIPIQPLDACDVAVDGSHIYWSGLGAIGRANLDGTSQEPNFIPALNNSCGIAVDGSHIYWANATAIGRANLDGTGNEPKFIPNTGYTAGIAVDGSHIYWGNKGLGAIGRANLNGTGVVSNFISAPGDPCDVAVDSSNVYWSNAPSPQGPSGVFSESLLPNRKSEPKKLIGSPTGCGVAVNSNYLYWGTESPRAIGRANLDGSSPDPSFIAGGASPSGLALDSLSAPPFVSLGNVHLNLRRGTAKIVVHATIGGRIRLNAIGGRIRLNGKGLVSFARSRSSAATYSLPLRPGSRVKTKLTDTGKAKVTFTPTGGTPEIEERALTLHKRR
jgi:hypothetical protein